MPSRSCKHTTRSFALSIGRGLDRAGFTANAVTLIGLLFEFASAAMAGIGARILAFVCLLGSSLCDLLDGAVARARGGWSRFGAALDPVVDRAGEAAMLAGVLVAVLRRGAEDPFEGSPECGAGSGA